MFVTDRANGDVGSVLVNLFRIILIENNINNSLFDTLMYRFLSSYRNFNFMNSKERCDMRANMIKELARNTMTWKVLVKFLYFIRIIKFNIRLRICLDSNEYVCSYNDIYTNKVPSDVLVSLGNQLFNISKDIKRGSFLSTYQYRSVRKYRKSGIDEKITWKNLFAIIKGINVEKFTIEVDIMHYNNHVTHHKCFAYL